MARSQSPGYPHWPLQTALEKALSIFKEDRVNAIDRESAVQHLGYGGLNGASDRALATLAHYGLIEPAGKGQTKITQLGMDVFAPANSESKARAIYESGRAPNVFQMIDGHFESRPSENSLRNWLIREGFQDRAIQPVIKSYFKTQDFMKQEGAIESDGPPLGNDANLDEPDDNDVVYGGAKVGDLIQYEISGALQLPEPARVRQITEDGNWLFVDGSETGIPMTQAIVEQQAAVAPPMLPLQAVKTPPLAYDSGSRVTDELNQIKIVQDGDRLSIHCDNVTAKGLRALRKKLEMYSTILEMDEVSIADLL